MAKIKKLIIILTIIFIVIALVLAILMSNRKKENTTVMPDEVGWEEEVEIENTLQIVDIRNNYYLAKRCVDRLYMYYSDLFKDPLDGYLIEPEEGTVDIEQIKSKRIEKIYNLLDEEYIEYKGITLENLTSKLPKIEEVSIDIEDMYYIEKDENSSAYFIYGNLKKSSDSSKSDVSVMIRLDKKNNTFKVLLGDYVEEHYKNLKVNEVVEFNSESIEKNLYNAIEYEHITDVDYINDLFIHYKNSLRASKAQSYNMLDETYKELCFENLEEYLSYLEEGNYLKIVTGQLDSYSKEKNSNYTQYLIKDKKDNYYIFRETAPFKYTVMLDNYVITTKDFAEEYSKSSDAKKVVLNIKKFFMGINDKNYGYSYNLLSNSFKSNKYPTKNDFINYVKQNLFEKNEIEYEKYQKENGVYIYEIKITDATGTRPEEKTFNMIVKLKDGTDFEMSFGED